MMTVFWIVGGRGIGRELDMKLLGLNELESLLVCYEGEGKSKVRGNKANGWILMDLSFPIVLGSPYLSAVTHLTTWTPTIAVFMP